MNNTYEKTVEYLPMFFETQLQFDPFGASIFEPLKDIIPFEQGYIFFLNAEKIKLRYLFGKNRKYSINDVFSISQSLQQSLIDTSSDILNSDYQLIKLLNFENTKSFLISKLMIRNTVFGFILLCSSQEKSYKAEDIKVLKSIASIISYKIKDAELSEIFKMQLKALKESVMETKYSYKTIKEQNFKILEADMVKNEFLANISHELRTPLNAIIGFSEILSTQLLGDLNPKQLEYIKDIHISGIHLLGMINEILDISKIEAHAMTLNKTEFSIVSEIKEVINIIKPLADKKSIIIEHFVIDDKIILADSQKIKQILYNLLSNAIKFSHANEKILISSELQKNKLIIKVKDNGIGIELKNHKIIFNKFIQLENTYTKTESSTGLGLTITKELVKMHGGKITLDSEIGKGATFIVTIPIKHKNDVGDFSKATKLRLIK
jgi:signal transduction histidine kinase